MKTKLTFLTLAIVALLGVGMLMAFKTEDNRKEYLVVKTFTASLKEKDNYMMVVDEKGLTEEVQLKTIIGGMSINIQNDKDNAIKITAKLNEIGKRGYKLILTNPGEYVFEKE